uniref:ShKT domain-containing protein n=1 Tax=Onchocerca volvulus TaxID=6282 RepID=A0A8R1XVW4_ONCVO
MQISDRLNPKSAPFTADVDAIKPEVPQRTGISRRIRPPSVQNLPDLSQSQTDQQIPAVTSLAQQQLENDQITLAKHRSAERFIQTLPHDQFQQISNQVIQNNTIPTVLSGPQQPFPFTKRPQFQQAMMRRLINSGIVTKKTKTCINFDPLQTCMDRMNYCEISQYMKIRCRKACRFC